MLADHHRNALLGNHAADELDDRLRLSDPPLTNVQSERLVRAEAVKAFRSFADEDDGDQGDFELKKREREEEEAVDDDEEYRRFLLEMGGGVEEVRRVLGMGDQPVVDRSLLASGDGNRVEGDHGTFNEQEKADRAKRKSRKAEADDNFLME